MADRSGRIKRPPHVSGGRVHAAQPAGLHNELVKFSFKYLDVSHASFGIAAANGDYFRALLERLRHISSWRAMELLTNHSNALRAHPIDFGEARVSADGFGIPSGAEYDRSAFQFSVSSNEYGRVHGFLIDTTFYVRWFDPEHRLYVRR
jgi:hypothetical protein